MSESPAGITTDISNIGFTESPISHTKKELLDPRTISKKNDPEGRSEIASVLGKNRQEQHALHQEMTATQIKFEERQSNLLVKLKTKLKIPDKKLQELETAKLEQATRYQNLPNAKEMVDAYYEKVSETPLTNQEKRDLLKPEVLSQISTDEYINLWRRLNPHFLSHVTRQGFRDHNAMFYHSAGMQEFHNGFLNVVNDEKLLRPPLALEGLKHRDETSVRIFLSKWALQAVNEEEAKKRFDNQLHWSLAEAPTYPDKTAVHFAAELVANDYYGGEKDNEVFFVFPSDVLASQYNFTFNGHDKDFTRPQSETKWNDVFLWPNSLENPGISINSGFVFLPESTMVDPNTGSKYASEIKMIDGKEQLVMIEDSMLVNKFLEYTKGLNNESDLIKQLQIMSKANNYYESERQSYDYTTLCLRELRNLGFSDESANQLLDEFRRTVYLFSIGMEVEYIHAELENLIISSSARFKKAENTIPAKDYWEKYFAEHPNLKPAHVVYYDGNPTYAIYSFLEKNGIGKSDTSKADGLLLGFDDHHVTDVQNDPRSNQGHQQLVTLGNRIIEEHYKNRL